MLNGLLNVVLGGVLTVVLTAGRGVEEAVAATVVGDADGPTAGAAVDLGAGDVSTD